MKHQKKSMKKLINFQHQNLFYCITDIAKKYFIKKSLIKFKSIHQIIQCRQVDF